MNSLVDIESIIFNNKQKFIDQEYIDLMKKLQSLCKMLETKICSNTCDEKDDEETECPYCGGTWYKSDYE
jgi:hypothetical protein